VDHASRTLILSRYLFTSSALNADHSSRYFKKAASYCSRVDISFVHTEKSTLRLKARAAIKGVGIDRYNRPIDLTPDFWPNLQWERR
jgi:hypothetical protein